MASTEVKTISSIVWSICSGKGGQLALALGGQFKPVGMVISFRHWVVNLTDFSSYAHVID